MTDQSRRSRRGPQIAAQRPDPSQIAPNRARFGIITFSTQVSGEPGPGQDVRIVVELRQRSPRLTVKR